jgi:hypothetical protein
MRVTRQEVDADGNDKGRAKNYTGTVDSVELDDSDSNGDGVTMLTVVMATDELLS